MKLTFMRDFDFKNRMFRSELPIIYISGFFAQINLHTRQANGWSSNIGYIF